MDPVDVKRQFRLERRSAASHRRVRGMSLRAIIHVVLDDRGQDLVEYALLSGIVGLAGILVFPVIAGKMGAAYTTWQSGAQTAWEPCAPAPAVCP